MSQSAQPSVKRDAEGTRQRILAAATDQFTTHGLVTQCAPSDAIRMLAHTVWTDVRENPGWLCLINNENLHQGRYVKSSTKFRETISPIVEMLRTTLDRGVATGEFRRDVDALDFYVTLVGMSYYIVSSRFTLDAFLGRNYMEQPAQESITAMHLDMLRPPDAGPGVAS